jgi:hypothetical protein
VRFIALCCTLLAVPAFAQQPPAAPGPYVIDLRGSMLAIPNEAAFFPATQSSIAVPSRGFGFDVGAHVYPFGLGPARVGIGANFARARGSLADPNVSAVITTLAPQLSFNFGTRDGWSYLSVGYGAVTVSTQLDDETKESGRLGSFNVGGGARWFLSRHLATSFDLRFYRVAPSSAAVTPGVGVFGASVGVSLR